MASETRRNAFIRRFARARRGAVAIEFAFVSVPFFLLLMALFELGLVFIVSMTLENATGDAARMIRTGQFQTGGAATKQDFEKLVCSKMTWLRPDCGTRMSVDVETFAVDDFAALAANENPDLGTFDPEETCFAPGKPGDIVMVRTFYQWPIFTPVFNDALVNFGQGKRLMSSVVSFRNEPYSNDNPTGAKCS